MAKILSVCNRLQAGYYENGNGGKRRVSRLTQFIHATIVEVNWYWKIANLLHTIDLSGTVILVYDILMAGIGKETDFSIGTMFIFWQICSIIPTVLFRYFFQLETLKTFRHSLLICLGQLVSLTLTLFYKPAWWYQHTSRRSVYAAFYAQNFSQNVFIIIQICSTFGAPPLDPSFGGLCPLTPTRGSAPGPRWGNSVPQTP